MCQKREVKIYIFLFFTLTVLFSLFPLTGDDFGWATSDGLKLLNKNFDGYNGRYLGNLCAIFFTRSDILRPVVKSLAVIFISFMMNKFSDYKDGYTYLVLAVLFVPYSPFIQSIVWTSGFFNYTFSLCFILPCFYIILNCECKKYIPVLILLGVSGQLFMETYTLATILFATGVLFLKIIKRKDTVNASVYLLSCITGGVIMFSNSAYYEVLSGKNKYQKLSGAETLIENLFITVPKYVLYACIPSFFILIVILICNKKYKFIYVDSKKLMIYCISALMLSVPFAFVGPIGTRCFLSVNIILLLIIGTLLKNVCFKKTAEVILTVVLCLDFIIYSIMSISVSEKIEKIENEVSADNKTIVLEHTDFKMFAHNMDAEGANKKNLNRFCEYYGFPRDIKIIFK